MKEKKKQKKPHLLVEDFYLILTLKFLLKFYCAGKEDWKQGLEKNQKFTQNLLHLTY